MTATSPRWDTILEFVSSELGVSSSFLDSCVIPSWLHSVSKADAAGLSSAIRDLASVLRISEDRLLNQTVPLIPDAGASRCKGAKPEQLSEQKPARLMAEILGRHLVSVLEDDEKPIIRTALELRGRLLEANETIQLKARLDLCWQLNVPVAHLRKAPAHAPHAMAINVDGRCAIVLIRNKQHQGWHLFDLAHELGHIMLGHVKPGEAIVDGQGLNLSEDEENEANQFAFELLTGSPMGLSFPRVMDGERLLRICKSASSTYRVDPQWLIVCVGFDWRNRWGVIGKALNLGWPDDDAILVVETRLLRELKRREVSRTCQALIKNFAVSREPVA